MPGPYQFSDYGPNGQALENFGLEAYCNVDGVALQTFGLVFPFSLIWNACNITTLTNWAACAGISSTTWAAPLGVSTTTWTVV